MGKLSHRTKKVLHQSLPSHLAKRHATKRIIRKLADDLGLVYFGYVDQQDDEHRLVRGITVSRTHDDHHYTVGTFKSYDIAFTIRRDTLEYPDKRLKDHYWTILTVDLHTTSNDIPHFYISHHRIREELLARFSTMNRLQLGAFAPYPESFTSAYEIYSSQEHAVEVQRVITPQLGEMIVQHFSNMSIEVADNTIYLYVTEKHPSRALLERMLNAGIWLAQIIDMDKHLPN